jgi:hypothetical protein
MGTATITPTPSITPTPGIPQCVDPTTISGRLPSDDSYIDANHPTTNHGNELTLQVRPFPGGNSRGVLRFDLSDIPANATVTSARLYLYEMNAKSNLVIYVYRVTGSWTESNVTWDFPWTSNGGDFDTSVAHALFIPGQQDCSITIELTSLVQGWVDGTYPNYGILLNAVGPSPFIEYASKEDTVYTERAPRLDITISLENQSQDPKQDYWLGLLGVLLNLFAN